MLTVVIPTHGRPDLLKRTLASFAECVLPASYRELVVVENGSRDGAEKIVARLPSRIHASYIYFPKGNKSAALNCALQKVPSDDLIVFFDDDVRLDSGVLTAYAQAAEEHPSAAFFGGPFGVDYEEEPADWLRLPPSARGWSLPEGTDEVDQPIFYGCNWAAFVSDLQTVNGFDPRFGPGGTSGGVGQETEMQKTLLNQGIQAHYVPLAKVWHYVPASRCSVEWSLQRAYRIAIRGSFETELSGPCLFGAPRWLYRKAAEEMLKAWFYKLARKPLNSYEHQLQYRRMRGCIDGIKSKHVHRIHSA